MNEILISDEYKQRLSNVSHEIRNHLSICDMYSQILKRTLENSGVNNSTVDNAIQCIQQSVKIMNVNLLDLKSINQSDIHITDFEKVVYRAFEMAKVYALDKNINFKITIKNSANIKVDENRFISCLVNIIKNGIEAIDLKGEIELIASVDNDIATIKISNNGKMIPKDRQDTVFEYGYTTKKSGSGIGLHICKEYLKSLSAEIKLTQSTKSKTTFVVTLPVYSDNY